MPISKGTADCIIMNLHYLATTLQGNALLLKYGKEADIDRAKRRLEEFKKDTQKMEGHENLIIEGLQVHYHFNLDEIDAIRPSRLSQYIKKIEEGFFDDALGDLRNLRSKLQEKAVASYFSKSLARACV